MDIDCLQDMIPYRFRPATSESPADIWELQSTAGSVFCKVFGETAAQLHYETTVYEYLDTTLDKESSDFFVLPACVRRNVSFSELEMIVCNDENISLGQLLRNMAVIQCGNPTARPALTDDSVLRASMIPSCDIDRLDQFRHMQYTILVTHRPNGNVRSMFEFIQDEHTSDNDKLHVLVQLVDVVSVMHTLGISHNDQHWGNVLGL